MLKVLVLPNLERVLLMKIKLVPQNEKQFRFVLNFLKDLITRDLYADDLLISLMFHKQAMYLLVSQHPDMGELFEDELFANVSKQLHYAYKVEIEIEPNEKFRPHLTGYSDFVIFSPSDTSKNLITFVEMLEIGLLECEHLEEFSLEFCRTVADAPMCLPMRLSTEKSNLDLVWIESSFVPVSHILGLVESRFLFPISQDVFVELESILKLAFSFRSLEAYRDQMNAVLLTKSSTQDFFHVFGASHKSIFESVPDVSANFFTELAMDTSTDDYYMLSAETIGLILEMLKNAKGSSFGYSVVSHLDIGFIGKKNPFRIISNSSFGFGFKFGSFYMRVKPLALLKNQNSPIQMYESTQATYKYQIFKKLSSRLLSRISKIFAVSEMLWDQAQLTIFRSTKKGCFGIYVHGYDLFGSHVKFGYILPFSHISDITFLDWCADKTFDLAQFPQAAFEQNCQVSFLVLEQGLKLRLEFINPNTQNVYAIALCAVQTSDQ